MGIGCQSTLERARPFSSFQSAVRMNHLKMAQPGSICVTPRLGECRTKEGLWFQSPLNLWGSGSIGRWLLWVWTSQWQQGHHGDFHSVFWTQRLSYETLMYVTLETCQLQKPGMATFPIPKVTESRQEGGSGSSRGIVSMETESAVVGRALGLDLREL